MKLRNALDTMEKSGRIKIERKSVSIDKLDSMLNYQRDISVKESRGQPINGAF